MKDLEYGNSILNDREYSNKIKKYKSKNINQKVMKIIILPNMTFK